MAEESASFDPKRAAEVLARAIELSRGSKSPQENDPYRRISLRELERAADEFGIDREHLHRAAVQVGETRPARPRGAAEILLGGPSRHATELSFSEVLDASAHEEIAGVIRDRMGETGTINVVGRSLSWTPTVPGYRAVQVEVRVTERGTRVLIAEHFGGFIGALYGGIVGGAGGGLGGALAGIIGGVLRAPGLGLAACGVMILISYSLAHFFFGRLTTKRVAQLESLAEDLERVVRERGSTAAVFARARVGVEPGATEREIEAETEALEAQQARRGQAGGN